MPISSTEIQNILSAQVGMFASSAQYAQAVSAQYGYQPGGGGGVDDPRNSPALQAGMLASGAVRYGTEAAGFAATNMAMFGMAPRVLDPFTSTFASATAGYRTAGMAGAIGAGAATAGAYMALGSVFKWGVDQVVGGAQQQAMLNYQMGQMAPNLSTSQLGQMSSMVSGAARMGMGSLNDITSMMQAGASDGSINTQSITQFQQSFQKLLGNVRQVASTLSSTLTEAQQAMQQVRAIGVGSDQAAGFLGSMRGIGYAGGLNPQQMFAAAAQGSQFGQMTGISRQAGAMGAMVNYGALGMVERGGMIEGVGPESYGRFNQGAMRFFGSAPGQRVLAAMMGPGGELNADVAQQVAAGTISRQQINEMARQNLGRRGARDMFGAAQGELMGQFMSQYGAQAIMPSVEAMAGGYSNPESVKSMVTGLTRAEMSQMQQLNTAMPGLRARMLQEGKEAFSQGSRQMGLMETLEASVGQMIQPFKDRLRQYGADLTQSAQDTIKQVTRDFMGAPPPAADPSAYARYFAQYAAGGGVNNAMSANFRTGMIGVGRQGFFQPSLPGAQTPGLSALPMGLRLGAMPGVSPSDLPMYGMAPESYNELGGAAALSMFPVFGGRNIYGAAGAGIGAVGRGITGALGGEGYGLFGLGGVGTIRGTGMAAGSLLRGAGGLLRGAGAVGAGLSMAALAGDVIFNEIPEMRRQYGGSPITQGAIMGDAAQTLQFASQQGLLSSPLRAMPVGSQVGGLDYESAQAQGLTPVGGLIADADQRYGRGNMQFFANAGQLQSAEALMSRAGSIMNQMQSVGPVGQSALQTAGYMGGNMEAMQRFLERSLPASVTPEQISQYLVVKQAMGFGSRQIEGLDVDKASRRISQQGLAAFTGAGARLPMAAENQMLYAAMDPSRAAAAQTKPLSKLLADLEGEGIAITDPRAEQQIMQALQAVTPGGNAALAYRALTGGLKTMTTYGQLGLPAPARGSANDEVPFNLMGKIAQAQAFAATAPAENQMLMSQQSAAEAAAQRASAIGGFDPAAMRQFALDYSSGRSESNTRMGLHGPLAAVADLTKTVLSDPSIGSRGILKMADQLEQSGTAAGIQGGAALREAARFRYQTRERKKADVGDVMEGILGVSFGGRADHKRLVRELGAGGAFGDQEFQAIAESGALRMLQRGRSPDAGPVKPEEVNQMVDQLKAAAQQYTLGNKEAFADIGSRISTFTTMPTSGPRQGDTNVQMKELMGNLKDFNDGLGKVNTTLQSIASVIPGWLSDERLKEQIETVEGSKYERLGLRGVTWVWNELARQYGLEGRSEGVVAQEVARLYPEAVGVGIFGWMFVRYDLLDRMLRQPDIISA